MNNLNLREVMFHKPKSTRVEANYADKYPEGMKRFVCKYLDHEKWLVFQKECSPGGIYYKENVNMLYTYFQLLIHDFMNTKFKWEKKKDLGNATYERVKDLPKDELLKTIDCLGYFLGLNPHNGSEHLLNVLEMFKMVG